MGVTYVTSRDAIMKWYCLFLKGRSEFTAETGLLEQGFEVYLPKAIDNKTKKIKPLFPEYMFINLEIGVDDFNAVKYTKGVRCFTPTQNPTQVPTRIIEELKSHGNNEGMHQIIKDTYYIGKSVTVVKGSFNMYEAIIHKVAKDRIWVIFDMMSDTLVEISKNDIK